MTASHPKVPESPKPDSNRRPSAYKADALSELSYQGVLVATRDGAIACRVLRVPPAKTTVTRAINSAHWPFALLPREDSNLHQPDPESGVLPLDHRAMCVSGPPTCCLTRTRT